MAVRYAANVQVMVVRGPDSSQNAETDLVLVEISCTPDGTNTVIGGTDTLDIATASKTTQTLVADAVRDGRAYTIVSYGVSQAAIDSAGVVNGATLGLSSGTIQITPKAANDWSTGATMTATAKRPFQVMCLCKAA